MKENKLQQFVNDEQMMDFVYAELIKSFLKERPGRDVYLLAASRLSVDCLNHAWKELLTYKINEDDDKNQLQQVGL
jgi:hypothetical protein